jgi:hypothetical protein
MGLTNSGLETAEKANEVHNTMKVKRNDYFNSSQDSIHKFQNKPEESNI